jgi:DNA-binding response OmpR family regulator
LAKILIIEDSERLGALLVERLERRGHAVMLAADPAAALASAKASQPDVILLEADLRGGEEWATARALKFDELTRDIPIIGLATNVSEAERSLAMQNGCRDLHGKPIDFGKLFQQIDAATPEPADEAEPDS